MFKNWKSILSWVLFMVAYFWSLWTERPASVIDVAGNLAVLMSIAMMFRSDFNSKMIEKLIDNLKNRRTL